jgi:hypothetical protein
VVGGDVSLFPPLDRHHRGSNEGYGYFLPKPWVNGRNVNEPEGQHEKTVAFMASRLQPYREYKRAYVSTKARDFYEHVLGGRTWRDRLWFTPQARKVAKNEPFIDRWTNSTDPRRRYVLDIAPTPTTESVHGARVFTFFTEPLRGSEQWDYFTGETAGLPARYLWIDRQGRREFRQAEDTLIWAIRDFRDGRTNDTLRRNLFTFLLLVLNGITVFRGLNATIPEYDIDTSTVYNIVSEIEGIPYTRGKGKQLQKNKWLSRFRVSPDAVGGK